MTRNPRDACVSYYNHWRVLEGYKGTFEDFAEAFVNDVCGYYAPFLPHVKGNTVCGSHFELPISYGSVCSLQSIGRNKNFEKMYFSSPMKK